MDFGEPIPQPPRPMWKEVKPDLPYTIDKPTAVLLSKGTPPIIVVPPALGVSSGISLVSVANEPVLNGKHSLDFDNGPVTLGRAEGVDVKVKGMTNLLGKETTANSFVSKRHASLTLDGKSVKLKDLGSKNGTFA